jgi:hypothetical protein
VAVLLCFLAQLVGIPALVGAIVAQIGVAAVSAALLLVTNTRVPWTNERDPYAQTTDELLRTAVMLPDGKVYGRRVIDDRHVVERLSDILEDEAAKRPPPAAMPPWAIEIASEQTPREEL